MSSRDDFLRHVRDALSEGRRVGHAPPLPARGSVGYQGAGPDVPARFLEMAAAMGAFPTRVSTRDDALAKIQSILETKNAHSIVLSTDPLLEEWRLADWLTSLGKVVVKLDTQTPRETLFAADVGITGVSGLLAETGSLVMAASPQQPRSASLLPPVHIALARAGQISADLFDALAVYSASRPPPSCLTLITGPSKTGDIELKLVTGVHGPGEVHILPVGND